MNIHPWEEKVIVVGNSLRGNNGQEYFRVGTLTIDEVMPHVVMPEEKAEKPAKVTFGDPLVAAFEVKMGSTRYHTFKHSGTKCVRCGLEATHFGVERNTSEGYHLNMYGIQNGREVLFTKDHIVPRSHGGSNHYTNMQTMCGPCNAAKMNFVLSEDDGRIAAMIAKINKAIPESPFFEWGDGGGIPVIRLKFMEIVVDHSRCMFIVNVKCGFYGAKTIICDAINNTVAAVHQNGSPEPKHDMIIHYGAILNLMMSLTRIVKANNANEYVVDCIGKVVSNGFKRKTEVITETGVRVTREMRTKMAEMGYDI